MKTNLSINSRCRFTLVLLLVGTSVAQAQSDQLNLESGIGTQLEDAYATAFRNRELQTFVRYDRTAEGKSLVLLNPALEFGPFRNTQVSVAVPIRLGTADRMGSGDIQVAGLYNFNAEGLVMPAIGLGATVNVPTGLESAGLDYTLRFAATKTFLKSYPSRIHVNVRYTHNVQPTTTGEGTRMMRERSDYWMAIIGYSGRITPTTLLVADFVREELRMQGQTASTIELALRRQINPRLVLSLGGGVGVANEAPTARGNFGFQQAF